MNWGTFCRKAYEITLLFTLFFVPLIFSPLFVRTFVIPKTFIFQFGTALAAFFLICSMIFHVPVMCAPLKKYQRLGIAIGFLMIFFMLLSTVFSVIPAVSLWGSYFRMQGFVAFSHYFLMGLLVFVYIQQKVDNIHRIFAIILSSASLVSIYAILQRYNLDNILWDDVTLVGRVFGSLSNPNSLAQFLVLTIPVTLGCFVAYKRRFIIGFSLVLQLFALIFSQGRTAALVTALSLFVFFYFITKVQFRKRMLHVTVGIMSVLIIGFGSIFTLQHYAVIPEIPLINRLSTTEVNVRSFEVRSILWKSSAPLLIDHPLLGFGADTFHYIYPKYRDEALHTLEDINASPDRTHNELYDFSLFFGFPFLLLYLVLAYIIMRVCYNFIKKEKHIQHTGLVIGMGSALLGHFLVTLMGFSLIPHFMLASVYVAIIFSFTALISADTQIRFAMNLNKLSGPLLLLTSLLVFSAASWTLYFPPVYADFLHRQSINELFITNSSAADVLKPLETAATIMPVYGPYAQYYADLARNFLDDPKLDVSEKKQIYDTAVHLMDLAISQNQLDSFSYVALGLLESRYASGAFDFQAFNAAQWNMRKALELNPKMPSILMEFGNVYFENKKWESAKEKYEQYLQLIPDYWKWKDDLANKTDYEQLQYRAFMRFNPQFDAILMKLAQSYANTGDFNRAEDYLLYIDDQNFEKYVILGDIYRFGDRFTQAAQAYRKALTLSPDNPAIKKALTEAENGIALEEEVVRTRKR